MTELPSLLLQRAAQRLEELASNATKGPWEASGYELYADDGEVIVAIDYDGGGFSSMDNGLWCAAMSPAVAVPLVAWLRAMSRFDSDWIAPKGWSNAVEFAKVILGEVSGA